MKRSIFGSTIIAMVAALTFAVAGCYPVCEGDNCFKNDGCDSSCDVTVNCGNDCCNTDCPDCPECQDCPDCPECQDCPECPDCPDCEACCGCEGQVTWLILQYTGAWPTVVKVVQHDNQVIFQEWVQPNQKFVVFGLANNGKMGPEIDLYVNCQLKCTNPCVLNTSIHTSCSQPIGPGLQSGDFLVVDGESYDFDGPLCDLTTN